MTPLKKAVTRRSEERMRDRSKFRRIIVTLHPAGFIGLRLEVPCQARPPLTARATSPRNPEIPDRKKVRGRLEAG